VLREPRLVLVYLASAFVAGAAAVVLRIVR
jgi:hypothetical protein